MANDGITAKFPTATVALTDFGGSHPPLSAPSTLILQTSLAAGDTSVVSTTTIPASFPAAGWITIDAEIIKYTSFAAATFTVTRGAQQTTAASHTANANIGLWFTPQEMNQIEAEVIALEAQFPIASGVLTPPGVTALAIGTTPATTGTIRIPSNTGVFATNSVASGNNLLIATDNVDVIHIADNPSRAVTIGGATTITGATATIGPAAGGKVIAAGTLTAGGLLTSAVQVATAGPLIYSGSGAPTISAAVKGSLYLRTDGTTTATRMYVATDTAGGWTAVTTAT